MMLEIYNEELDFISQDFNQKLLRLSIMHSLRYNVIKDNLINRKFTLNQIKVIASDMVQRQTNELNRIIQEQPDKYRHFQPPPSPTFTYFSFVIMNKSQKEEIQNFIPLDVCYSVIFLVTLERILNVLVLEEDSISPHSNFKINNFNALIEDLIECNRSIKEYPQEIISKQVKETEILRDGIIKQQKDLIRAQEESIDGLEEIAKELLAIHQKGGKKQASNYDLVKIFIDEKYKSKDWVGYMQKEIATEIYNAMPDSMKLSILSEDPIKSICAWIREIKKTGKIILSTNTIS